MIVPPEYTILHVRGPLGFRCRQDLGHLVQTASCCLARENQPAAIGLRAMGFSL